ncbi:hypothetical protein QJS66_06115 [Kocuria rhizophila]|nr:hypothetical protein QJS66_06115 [Kocuria rhizophila]
MAGLTGPEPSAPLRRARRRGTTRQCGGPGRGRDGYGETWRTAGGDRDARHRDAPGAAVLPVGCAAAWSRPRGRPWRIPVPRPPWFRCGLGTGTGRPRRQRWPRGPFRGAARPARGGPPRPWGDRLRQLAHDCTETAPVLDGTRPRFVAGDRCGRHGRKLDRTMHHELKALEPSNAEPASQHLVMAARYLDATIPSSRAGARERGRPQGGTHRRRARGRASAAYAAGDYALARRSCAPTVASRAPSRVLPPQHLSPPPAGPAARTRPWRR